MGVESDAIRRIVDAAIGSLRLPGFRWATVTQVSPLRIQFPGEAVLPFEPIALCRPAQGARVLVAQWQGRICILGQSGGATIVGLGSGVNLDTLLDWKTYTQALNAAAASGSNYPVPLAGVLEVMPIAGGAGEMIWQRYTTYRHTAAVGGEEIGPTVYVRSFYSGAWSPWVVVGGEPRIAGVVSAKTYYEKYPDGRLICRGSHGWSASTGTQSYAWTFPVAFAGEFPDITITEDTVVPQNVAASITALSLTGVTIWHYRSTAAANTARFKAEGRWK